MQPPEALGGDGEPATTGPGTPPATYAALALIAGAVLVAVAGPSPLWLYAPAFVVAGAIAYAVDRRIRALERAQRRPP